MNTDSRGCCKKKMPMKKDWPHKRGLLRSTQPK